MRSRYPDLSFGLLCPSREPETRRHVPSPSNLEGLLSHPRPPPRFRTRQALALALRVEHLVWGMEEMSAGLSMGQLDTLKTVLLDQVARVDEAKVRDNIAGVSCRRRATWLRPETWCQSRSTHAHDAKDFWVWLICAGRQHEKSSFFFFAS